jgi:hypothetical protein
MNEPIKSSHALLLNRLAEMQRAPYYATARNELALAEQTILDLEGQNRALKTGGITKEHLRALCALLMCSDPWPVKVDKGEQTVLEALATSESQKFGFSDWIAFYHSPQ